MSFNVKDCTLITRMAGIDTALNLRELRDRIVVSPNECLFHHFCETVIRPAFDDPEFRNDFAIWASRDLRDRILAERLGAINPYSFESLDEVRQYVVDIIDDRLADLKIIPWVNRGEDFRFMQALTVVFETNLNIEQPHELPSVISEMSLSSIYYHFVEARRRTENRTDDFTAWLAEFGDSTLEVRQHLSEIDFYFLTLPELKRQILEFMLKCYDTEKARESHS